MSTQSKRARWSSRWGFIFVATGAAAGLGNIWKFPYIAGENGGGAFMLVYLLAIAFVALPVLIGELMLGRLGDRNLIDGIRRVAVANGHSGDWSRFGWIGLLAVFVVLSFYSVVGGWTLKYLSLAVFSGFGSGTGASGEYYGNLFHSVTSSPAQSVAWQSAFIALTAWVVGSGVRVGIENLCRYLMPLLFCLLVLLAVYNVIATDQFGASLRFLFLPDFETFSAAGALIAVGHAFFTLGVGVGAMLTFGSYLPRNIGLARAGLTVATLDTLVAVLAAMAIFPIVFASQVDVGSGPGLVFVTLPIAFEQMPAGGFVAAAFFTLLAVAALTSAPSMLDPMVEFVRERCNWSRKSAALKIAAAVWLLGVGQTLSFSEWSDLRLLGKNLFEASDFLVSNLLLPTGGVLIAVFVGWMISPATSADQLGARSARLQTVWRVSLMWIAPIAIVTVTLGAIVGWI